MTADAALLTRELGRDEALESLAYIRDELRKCKHMEPIYWQRREADLESRRVDTRNKTYKDSTLDLSYPAPGCGAGPWDGIPPGHKAQAVDLEVATPVLQKLGLPPTWDGYDCVFGRAYLGSPLARGSLWRAAQAHPEVEALRYEVALASALH